MHSKLYVGNLAFDTAEEDLRAAFEPFGTIVDLEVASDRFTGRPRGFAFVTLETADAPRLAAAQLNGVALKGRALSVNPAKTSGEGTPSPTRAFDSPNRRAGAFYARGRRRR